MRITIQHIFLKISIYSIFILFIFLILFSPITQLKCSFMCPFCWSKLVEIEEYRVDFSLKHYRQKGSFVNYTNRQRLKLGLKLGHFYLFFFSPSRETIKLNRYFNLWLQILVHAILIFENSDPNHTKQWAACAWRPKVN